MNKETYSRSIYIHSGKTGDIALIAILVASASTLQVIESPLPRFLPWLKLGLANTVTLYALLRISVKASLGVAVLRTFIASAFLGTLFSPVHALSFVGATSSAIIMSLLRSLKPDIGLAILSIAGAITNNFSQIAVIQLLFDVNLDIWWYLALTIWIAIPSGLIVAKITQETLHRSIK